MKIALISLCSYSLVVTLSLLAGCGSSQKPAAKFQASSAAQQPTELAAMEQGKAPSQAAADPAAAEATAQPPAATPDILAKQAAIYAKSLESSISHPSAGPASANAAKSAPQLPLRESQVTWVDPNEFRLGNQPVQPTVDETAPAIPAAALIKPIVDSQPAEPNTVAVNNTGKSIPDTNSPASITDLPDKSPVSHSFPAADPMEEKLARRMKDYPRDVSAHLDYQMLKFLRDEQVPDMTALAPLPNEDRELVTAVLDGMSNFRNTLRADNNLLLSRKIKPLTEMSERLRSQADLSIPTLVLCTRVDGFGRYEPIEPAKFVSGKEKGAIIYCEIENFGSQMNAEKKMWETDIAQEAVLFTESGMQVWTNKTPAIQDFSRNRRRDFFVRTLIKIPSNLNVGRYLLKVTIVDQQANRVAEATIPVQIVAGE